MKSTLFAHVDALLDALDARALPWGIVTNKATRYTTPPARLARISPLARRRVVCGDTTPLAKPHPAPAARRRRTASASRRRSCVYVGDARRDIEAGNAAGMRTLVARWGYIEPDDAPDSWPADGILDEPVALLTWLHAASGH